MANNPQGNVQLETEKAEVQRSNRFLIIAIILMIVFFTGLYIIGPSIGLYLPCHTGIQITPNATVPAP